MSEDPTHFYQSTDFIALEMGRLAATRIDAETLQAFKASIERKRAQVGDNKYYRMWDAIVSNGPTDIRAILTQRSERAQVLRSVISFRAFISKQERDAIFREYLAKGAEDALPT